MTKVLFSEGGQPVYLDDLAALQYEYQYAIDSILAGLGVNLENGIYFIKKPIMTRNGSSFSFTDGILWHDRYGIIYLSGAEGMTLDRTERAYIKIDVAENNFKTFEDGQIRPTRQLVTARLVNSPIDADYLYSSVDELIGTLASLIDRQGKTDYTGIEVEWANGYLGTVEYKQIYGGYRYHIFARSQNSEWSEMGKQICYGNFHPAVSSMFLTGGDTPSRDTPHYLILSREGYIIIDGGSDIAPLFTPIDITFDVLNNQ